MYKDGRFANLQRRREYDREYRKRRAATETPQEKETPNFTWSIQFLAVETHSHLVSYNCFRSQPLVPSQASPVRRHARRQKKQYTSSSVGLAQARPNNN